MNHSHRPNVEAGDDGRFRALRRIRKGEELTADYRTFTDEGLPSDRSDPTGVQRRRRSAGVRS